MIYISYCDHHNIVSIVVGCMIPSNVVFSEVENIISVSLFGLAHHVFSIDIEVNVFNKSFHVSIVVVFVLLRNFFFDQFKFLAIKSTVTHYVSENFNSMICVIFKDSQSKFTLFSSSLRGVNSS